ncbi:DUF47 family protein [Eubacteriales bacterium OttesenSCG-928-K08]|nr:DUF47 family protein [Eubacteriales bacterium OttesenSCG-928-K08]
MAVALAFGRAREALGLVSRQADNVLECCNAYVELLAAQQGSTKFASAQNQLELLAKRISTLDSSITDKLLSGVLLPGTRKEIFELCVLMNTFASHVLACARLAQSVWARFTFLPGIKPGIIQIVESEKQQAQLINKSVHALCENYNQFVSDSTTVRSIKRHGSRIDDLHQRLTQTLYSTEPNMNDKFYLQSFLDKTAILSDDFCKIAEQLQSMQVCRNV